MIFVFRIGSLGDSIVSLPTLHYIKKIHSNEKIVLITSDNKNNKLNTWNIVKYANIFDDVLTYSGKKLSSILNLIIKIRSVDEKKTLYYIPPFRSKKQVLRDRFIFKTLGGIDVVIGFDQAVASLASRDQFGRLKILKKEYDRLLKAVMPREEHSTVKKFLPSTPLIKPAMEHYEKVKATMPIDFNEKTCIAIAHGSNMSAKKWELKHFASLMGALNRSHSDLLFILVGGHDDFEEGKQLETAVNNCINAAGSFSIIESAALLEQCVLFIGNDTGTMHLASVMGTKTIGIFSARDNPGKWEPYGNNNTVLRKQVECEGCMLIECIDKDKLCTSLISTEEVSECAEIELGTSKCSTHLQDK